MPISPTAKKDSGWIVCHACPKTRRTNSEFCPHCRAPKLVAPPASKKCVACAEEILLDAKLCKHCRTEQPEIAIPVALPVGTSVAMEQPVVRGVGFLLGVGIILLPFVFSWFTLRKRHSTTARVIAFGWMITLALIIRSGDQSPTITAEASKQPIAPQVSPTTKNIGQAPPTTSVAPEPLPSPSAAQTSKQIEEAYAKLSTNLREQPWLEGYLRAMGVNPRTGQMPPLSPAEKRCQQIMQNSKCHNGLDERTNPECAIDLFERRLEQCKADLRREWMQSH